MIPQEIKIKDPTNVKDGADYFITRHGGWYRPKAQGYTDDIAKAGIFPGIEARQHLGAEGVRVVPLELMRAEIGKEIQDLLARVGYLSEIITRS